MRHETILLADDNQDDILLMECALRKAGIRSRVKIVHDGRQALDYLRGEGRYGNRDDFPCPSLIVLDLRLPRIDGLEVLRWIRDQPCLAEVPVILWSGCEEEDDCRAAEALGASACLAKPLGFAELVDLVHNQLTHWVRPHSVAA